MKVYILKGHTDYEGFEILGIYDSKDKGLKEYLKKSQDQFYDMIELVWHQVNSNKGGVIIHRKTR